MTLARPVVCAVAALALLTGGVAAQASPGSGSCTVMTDPAGDATGTEMGVLTPPEGTPTPPNDSYLDLRSATLASDGRLVTTALRLSAMGVDLTSPDSSFFEVDFSVARQELTFMASVDNLGMWSYWWFNNTTEQSGDAWGRVDADRKEIRMTAPAAALSSLLRRGATIHDIHVRVGRFLPIGLGAFQTVDSAATGMPHVVGTRSCLKPVH